MRSNALGLLPIVGVHRLRVLDHLEFVLLRDVEKIVESIGR